MKLRKLRKNLARRRFGKWKVIGIQSRYPTVWLCECACGTRRGVLMPSLTSGHSRSCGCSSADYIRTKRRLRPFEAVYRSLLRGAVKSGQSVALSYEEFLCFVAVNECHYCCGAVEWKEYLQSGSRVPYNLDRKNNDLGYSVLNCVVCCKRCNFGKADRFSYEEWVEIGKTIRAFRENRLVQGVSR